MPNLLTLLGLAGPIAMIIALLVMALLSQRLGAVTKRRRAYRWFFVAVGLITAGILARLLALGGTPSALAEATLLYTVSVTIALTLAVSAAWRYWGWLLSERGKETDQANNTNKGKMQ